MADASPQGTLTLPAMPKKPPKPRGDQVTGPPLKLTYEHESGLPMDALVFASYLIESIKAVKQTVNYLAGRTVRVQYKIEALTKNSPEVVAVVPYVAQPLAGVVYDAQVRHVKTVAEIQEGRIPDNLEYPLRLTYRRLGRLSKQGHFSARVQANGISVIAGPSLENTLALHLAREPTSIGTIRGHIRAYRSDGSERLVRIVPRVGDPVVGRYREADREKVRGLIDVAYVEAYGRMRYKSGAYQPYHIDIDTIDALNVAGAPSFADMQGFAPDFLDGRDIDDFMGAARNGW